MPLNRRHFLISGLASAGALAGGGWWVVRGGDSRDAGIPALVAPTLRYWLDDEHITDEVMAQYTQDFHSAYLRDLMYPLYPRSFRALQLLQPWIADDRYRKRMPVFLLEASAKAEQLIVEKFLLSTNYFLARQPGDPLIYRAYADPYRAPCTNPVARFVPDTGTQHPS